MRNRLLFTYAAVMVLTIFISFVSAIVFLGRSSADYLTQKQAANTEAFLQHMADYYAENHSWQGIDAFLESSSLLDAEREYFQFQQILLVSPEGKAFYSVDPSLTGSKINRFYLSFASKIKVEGKTVGNVVSGRFLKRLPSDFSATVYRLFLSSLLRAAIVALVVGLCMATLMAYQLMRPVQATLSAARKISEGDFTQRVPMQTYSGISELVTAINEMAVSLEKNDLKRGNLFNDLAHDFRTPLAVQRATIEAVEDGVYPFNQDTLTTLKNQNTHLSRMVDDLGLLARMDAGRFTLILSTQDLAEFTLGFITRFKGFLSQQNRLIRIVTLQMGLMVEIDTDRIDQILENIFQNALLYTPDGTPIDVAVFQQGTLAVLTVRDHGPGIPEDKRETIFDRYYQLNREDGQNSAGQGIGLAIARRLARVHGGNLYARNHRDGGAQFILELPLSRGEKSTQTKIGAGELS